MHKSSSRNNYRSFFRDDISGIANDKIITFTPSARTKNPLANQRIGLQMTLQSAVGYITVAILFHSPKNSFHNVAFFSLAQMSLVSLFVLASSS